MCQRPCVLVRVASRACEGIWGYGMEVWLLLSVREGERSLLQKIAERGAER